MDIGADLFNSSKLINSSLEKKDNIVGTFKDAIQNKDSKAIGLFWKNLLFIYLFSIGVVCFFDKELFLVFTDSEDIASILNYLFYVFSIMPIVYYLVKIINIPLYFTSSIRTIKKQEIVNKNSEFQTTRKMIKDYYSSRFQMIIKEIIVPLIFVGINVLFLISHSLEIIIGGIIITVLSMYYDSKSIRKCYSCFVKTEEISKDLNKIKNATFFTVGGSNYAFQKENFEFYFLGQNLLQLSLSLSLFERKEALVIKEYCEAYIPLVLAFKNSIYCKNKQEIEKELEKMRKIKENIAKIL